MFLSRPSPFFIPGQTPGALTYFDGGAWVSLPAGTPGFILQTQGFGLPPVWAPNPPPGMTRKRIPTGETVVVIDGGQYLVCGTFTLEGTATLVLEGDADLVVFTGT
jgi:hypothetical protein